MAQGETNIKRFNFVKGLITESSSLTFPENAAVDIKNVKLNRDGSFERRLGLDVEDTPTSTMGITYSDESQFQTLEVLKVKDTGDDGVFVNSRFVQAFFKYTTTGLYNTHLEGSSLANLTEEFDTTTSVGALFQVQDGNNNLSSTSPSQQPLVLYLDVASAFIGVAFMSPQTRDFTGVGDSLNLDERPTTLSNEHRYNLINQGFREGDWTQLQTDKGYYPSNADVAYLGYRTNVSSGTREWNSDELIRQYFGTTGAPKGSVIRQEANYGIITAPEAQVSWIETHSISRSTTAVQIGEGLTAVASFSGRVFFAGYLNSDRSRNIYFSRILPTGESVFQSALHAEKWYQEADPTSENINEIVDTDGGVIKIPTIGKVKKMVPYRDSLLIFADNGVWQLSPGEKRYFTPTSYSLSRVTVYGMVGKESAVVANDFVFYWANEGIIALSPDKITGLLKAQNASVQTIQTLYDGIEYDSKRVVFSCFDYVANKIYWFYENSYNASDRGADRILVLDLQLQAFYIYETTKPVDGPRIRGAIINPLQSGSNEDRLKILCVVQPSAGNYSLQWATFSNTNFEDWVTYYGGVAGDGDDADAYIVTGYELAEDAARRKQAPYVTFLMRRTETGTEADGTPTNPGSVKYRARWDWADADSSGKWGNEQQAYKLRRVWTDPTPPSSTFGDGYPVVWSKKKIRGSGKALSLKLYTEASKDFNILGWQIHLIGETET